MIGDSFLNPVEMNEIQLEFGRMLNSFESCDIMIQYKLPTGTTVEDAVYGDTISTAWTQHQITTRASQEIIHPRNIKVLDWGILEAGDCIFYIATTVDLTVIDELQNAVIVCNGVKWLPVTRKLKAFYNYLLTRFGNGQVGQIIPCKLQQ